MTAISADQSDMIFFFSFVLSFVISLLWVLLILFILLTTGTGLCFLVWRMLAHQESFAFFYCKLEPMGFLCLR